MYVKEAWEALFPVSLEVDAVLSLAEEVEQLKKKTTIPVNHLTSESTKGTNYGPISHDFRVQITPDEKVLYTAYPRSEPKVH